MADDMRRHIEQNESDSSVLRYGSFGSLEAAVKETKGAKADATTSAAVQGDQEHRCRESEAVTSAAAMAVTARLPADAQAAMLTAKLCSLSGTITQMAVGLQNPALGPDARVLAVAHGIEALHVALAEIGVMATPNNLAKTKTGPGSASKAHQQLGLDTGGSVPQTKKPLKTSPPPGGMPGVPGVLQTANKAGPTPNQTTSFTAVAGAATTVILLQKKSAVGAFKKRGSELPRPGLTKELTSRGWLTLHTAGAGDVKQEEDQDHTPLAASPAASTQLMHQEVHKLAKMSVRQTAAQGVRAAAQGFRRLLKTLTIPKLIDNEGRFYYRWSIMMMLGVLYSAIVVPFGLAWETTMTVGTITVAATVDIAIEIMFLVDIAIHFRLPYLDSLTREPVESKDKIRRKYLHGWFCVDVVSALPIELTQFAWVAVGGAGETSGAGTMSVLSATRMLKLLRMAKLVRLRAIEAISKEYPTQVRPALASHHSCVSQATATNTHSLVLWRSPTPYFAGPHGPDHVLFLLRHPHHGLRVLGDGTRCLPSRDQRGLRARGCC